jgi:hypothetical protein
VLSGTCRITTEDQNGKAEVADIPLSGNEVILLFCNEANSAAGTQAKLAVLKKLWKVCCALPDSWHTPITCCQTD